MIILLEQRLKDTEIDRTKLQRENSNKEQQIEKLQKSLDETKDKCDRIKKELSFVNKETDILKQGQRQAASIKSNLETKLSRALEENERIKTEMRQLKQASKEAQENYQRKMEELSTENRRIDK
ncbi:Testis-expressed sequence 9 protein, partial [Stegodyphus mimosarum]